MKYEAKYLPVDEPIKEGDMTYHPVKGLYKAVRDDAYCNQKKVKLFLISRDIQVGEISEEAIWVKEGDQFELKDINPITAAYLELGTGEPTDPIKIKCKCCNSFK